MIPINKIEKKKFDDKYKFQRLSPTKFGVKSIKKYQETYIKNYLIDVPKDADILEIGGGRGYFAEACIKRGWNYCTIEKSIVITESLQKRGLKAINASIPPIPINGKMFDLIHADQVIEHLNNHDEAIFLVQECWRVLKPSGILSIVCPNILSQKFYFYEIDYSHSYPTSKYRLEWLLKDYDFQILYSGYFLNWNNSKQLIARVARPPLLSIFNFFRSGFVAGLLNLIGMDSLRKRILKTCADNVVIIGRKR